MQSVKQPKLELILLLYKTANHDNNESNHIRGSNMVFKSLPRPVH